MINLLLQALGKYHKKRIDIMSIGAGVGNLKDTIIKHSQMRVNNI